MAINILVSENHRPTALAIKQAFSHLNYSLTFKPETNHALDYLNANPVDALVIGIEPAGMGQGRMCEEIRQRGLEVPIMVITDKRNLDESIRVLRYGADDYVDQFSYRELVARTVRLIERPPLTKQVWDQFGELSFNKQDQVFMVNTDELKLVPREFQLLKLLFEFRERPVSRERISSRLSTYRTNASSDAIDVHVTRLRKKLRLLSTIGIKTVYGVGYSLTRKSQI
jgi:two-component system response regulator TctD